MGLPLFSDVYAASKHECSGCAGVAYVGKYPFYYFSALSVSFFALPARDPCVVLFDDFAVMGRIFVEASPTAPFRFRQVCAIIFIMEFCEHLGAVVAFICVDFGLARRAACCRRGRVIGTLFVG